MKFYIEVTAMIKSVTFLQVVAEDAVVAKKQALKELDRQGKSTHWVSMPDEPSAVEVRKAEAIDPTDSTEFNRRMLVTCLNLYPRERESLEVAFGQVWDSEQLQKDFEVLGFLAPFCHVVRKSDKKEGSMTFQHLPRFYWGFETT